MNAEEEAGIVLREAERWAFFLYALHVNARLPNAADLNDASDEARARAAITAARLVEGFDFQEALEEVRKTIEYKYQGGPDDTAQSALEGLRGLLEGIWAPSDEKS
jgi:hypothetical protein